MPDQPDTDLANRLRLAHQARRAKAAQLDDVRRALCDVGAMQDDDPYSHADLADVIRQAWPTETGDAPSDDETAQCPKPDPHAPHMWTWREEGADCPGLPEAAVAAPATADDGPPHSAISRLKELVEWRTAEVLRLTELTAQYADRAIANGKRAELTEAATTRVRRYIAGQMAAWPDDYPVVVPARDVLAMLDAPWASTEPEASPAATDATVARVRALAADMRDWCSPYGIAVDYAQRIDDALDGKASQ